MPRLLAAGWRVRAVARSLEKLAGRPWARDPHVELVAADVLDREALAGRRPGAAARRTGSCTRWTHVTSTSPQMDRRAAENMAAVAQREGLSRVIYLGGLGEDTPELSAHLRSRAEVGQVLAAGPVPATILRAGMILGSGSASFEILRYLVDRLPAMVTPRWVGTPSQPIAIRNVLGYLVGCLEHPETAGRTFDIGGPEVLTYRRLMELYAEEAGLRRRLVVRCPC